MEDSLRFTGSFGRGAAVDIHFSTILINDDIVIATLPGEPFNQLQLDWKRKVDAAHLFLFGYTWHAGTWANYVSDIKSAALGGCRADQSSPKMIEVGSGEARMNKHLENLYRLNGLMREEPRPVGFKPGPPAIRFPRCRGTGRSDHDSGPIPASEAVLARVPRAS
jgi:hypothetical protein